jgi:hypothetical protein
LDDDLKAYFENLICQEIRIQLSQPWFYFILKNEH